MLNVADLTNIILVTIKKVVITAVSVEEHKLLFILLIGFAGLALTGIAFFDLSF